MLVWGTHFEIWINRHLKSTHRTQVYFLAIHELCTYHQKDVSTAYEQLSHLTTSLTNKSCTLPSTLTPSRRVNSSVSSSSSAKINVVFTRIGRIVGQYSLFKETAFEYIFLAYSLTLHNIMFKRVSTSDKFVKSSVLFEMSWRGIDSDSIVCRGLWV